MKYTLTAIALALACFGASAQSANSGSNSGADSTSGSASQSAVNANNSGNVSATATGNQNASRSDSASQSGALSGSQSGAMGNNVTLNQNVPAEQRINSNVSGSTSNTSTSTNQTNVTGGTTNNNRETYDGTQRIISSGGTTDFNNTNIHYSGSQTIKNVPSIAMSGPASGPCTGVSGGLGLSGPGWGVGLNGSAVMVDCRLRENTRVLGMGMQSLDGAANPQEKGEATVMFMDAMRALASYNQSLAAAEAKDRK